MLPVVRAVKGRCQDFTASNSAGKLKNWKSENLTSRPATQLPRIPGFQDFRFSPPYAARKSGRGILGWGEVGNVPNMLEPDPLRNDYINNQLMS